MSSVVPDGYERHARRSPLTDPWEPLYARTRATDISLAVELREPHCNSRGFAHGGLVSALADNAMGWSAVAAARATLDPPPQGAVTVSLTLDFIDSANVGEWLEVRPVVHVVCGERLVARGSATFRLM